MSLRLLAFLLSALFIASCKPKDAEPSDSGSVDAPATSGGGLAINAAEPSPHFAEVMKHLDVGGSALHYRDHEGREEFWVALFETFMEVAEMTGEEIPENLDMAEVIKQSGLGAKKASGYSISKDGRNWLMRHYAHYPDGMTPNGAILGKAKEFRMPKVLPATTDIAFEANINATHMPEFYRKNAGLIGSKEEVEEMMNQELPIGMTVGKLLSLSDAHVMMGMEFQKAGQEGMPPMPEHWIMELTLPNPLIVALMPMIKDMMGEMQPIGTHQGWALPVPPDAGFGKPVMIKEDGVLRIASTIEYIDSLDGCKKLADDVFYKVATNQFPDQRNCQIYISPKVTKVAKNWMKLAIQMEDEMQALSAVVDKIDDSKPWSICMVVHPTGIETIAEMPYAIDPGTATIATMALGGTSVLFVGARAWKRGSDRSAVILNIRNCQQAMRGHQNMHNLKVGDPFTAKDLQEYMMFPQDIKVDGGYIRFEAGDSITPNGKLWLKVTGPGMDGALGTYGFSDETDYANW